MCLTEDGGNKINRFGDAALAAWMGLKSQSKDSGVRHRGRYTDLPLWEGYLGCGELFSSCDIVSGWGTPTYKYLCTQDIA